MPPTSPVAPGDHDAKTQRQVRRWRLEWPHVRVAGGLLPLRKAEIAPDILAGLTLAALGIPEVLGYATIAHMPLVTGLYTILLPLAVFALFGSSRHLVVGADSATAAIVAAGLAPLAAAGSPRFVQLAEAAALLAGVALIVARLARLGFLANFLSRTMLVGFLTGVGISVAAGQVADLLGLPAGGHSVVAKLAHDATALHAISWPTVAVAASVLAVIVAGRTVARRVPAALVAVVGATALARPLNLARHGVALVGRLPGGLPHLSVPHVQRSDLSTLAATALSLFVVILAQSAATSGAYAARYDETFDENTDLVGLALANAAAAFTGTFVVNGSPTKTEMVDAAGGRSQLAQLTTAAVVLVVLLLLTGPVRYLPTAALAAVVFLIGVELVDIASLRRIWQVRRDEFVVAVLTAAAVVFVGVEQGILLAVALSVIDHLRYSYHPRDRVLVPADDGTWRPEPVAPGARSTPRLVVYRFGSSLYYANGHRLLDEVHTIVDTGAPPAYLALDAAAIGDIDYTAAQDLRRLVSELDRRHITLLLVEVAPYLRTELDRYGLTELYGPDAYQPTLDDARRVSEQSGPRTGDAGRATGDGRHPPS